MSFDVRERLSLRTFRTIRASKRSTEMLRLLTMAMVIVSSVAFAQPNSDKQTTTPPPHENQNTKMQPLVGATGISPELRSNMTKDVPMGNGKGKATAPATGSIRQSH